MISPDRLSSLACPRFRCLGACLIGVTLSIAPLAAQTPSPEANPGAAPAQEVPGPNPDAAEGLLAAVPFQGEIRVDGVLDEPVWTTAHSAGDFRQQEPDEGQPATFPTQVWIAYGSDRLYIGARLEDPEPERLIARVLERDGLFEQGFLTLGSNDDAFMVVLDTYDDGRSGFVFATNPNGAEADALVRREADLNTSWDAVWSVASAVDSAGWTAEIAIPFWSLRFAKGDVQRWGVNFQRIIKRRNETVLWRSWTRDNGGLLKVSQGGALVGLAGLEQGLNLQLKPFALAEGRRDDLAGDPGDTGETEGSLDAGLDVKFGVTSNLTLDGTINTDFAQVEADVRQINLTRFSLFFPEKREFFLEGAGIFDFGIPGFEGPPAALLFFSRRIGIESGFEVPILAGAKITGKEGPYTVGVLDVVTDEQSLGEEESEAPRTNFGVLRLIRDVGSRSTVGAIATHHAPAGSRSSSAVGLDTHVQISQKMVFDAFAAGTDAPGTSGESTAYRAALDFTADQWGWFAEHSFIGSGFEPSVGFVLRTDVNRQFAAFRVTPRPPIPGLRRTDIRLGATIVSSGDWEIRDRNYRLSVSPQLDSGDGAELALRQDFARLVEPFQLSEDVVFPIGDYEGESFDATLFSSSNRPVSATAFAGTTQFFSGRNRYVGANLTVVASRKLSFEAFWDHNDIATPHGDLVTDLGTFRVNYALSTHLFTNALIQYDSVADRIEANVRVNFIHSPGSDLFVVLNEQRGEAGDLFAARNRALVVKFTKLLNL